MEIIIGAGTYKFRAVLVDRFQECSWLCQEFTNVGLETEGKLSQWVCDSDSLRQTLADLVSDAEDDNLGGK